MGKEKGLSTKQRIFIEEYINNGFDGTKAAINAGYKEKHAKSTAYKLLHNNELVKEQLSIRSKEIIEERKISADELYDYVGKVVRNEYKETRLVKKNGDIIEVKVDVNPNTLVKACDLYAKLRGFVTDDNEEQTIVNIVWDIDDEEN